MKGGNSDVARFQYKINVFFHLKLKMFLLFCVKVENT